MLNDDVLYVFAISFDFLWLEMEYISNKEKSRDILTILCKELYPNVKDIVNKYSEKQEEKTIVNEE